MQRLQKMFFLGVILIVFFGHLTGYSFSAEVSTIVFGVS